MISIIIYQIKTKQHLYIDLRPGRAVKIGNTPM